jgi:hypothetical protein
MSPLALAHTTGPAAIRRIVMRDEYLAFASLALTQRKLAHKYRAWMAEDEAKGDLASYRKHRSEARRYWRNALWNLSVAMDRKAAMNG